MPRLSMQALAEKYGLKPGEVRGDAYRDLMKTVTAREAESVARGVARMSADVMRGQVEKLGDDFADTVRFPDYEKVIPTRNVFLRKAAQDGDVIADTLRNKLTGRIRAALEEKNAAGQPAYLDRRGRLRPAAVKKLREEMRGVYKWYTGREGQEPGNLDQIATTEMNSVVNAVKHEYNAQFSRHNSDIGAMRKTWRQNKHLSKVPRQAHTYMHGCTIALDDLFNVPIMRRVAGGREVRKGWEKMAHPHAAGASAGNVINCHCTCDYVFTLKQVRPKVEIVDLPRKRPLQSVRPKLLQLSLCANANLAVYKTGRCLQGRIEMQGLQISIENKRGSVRQGVDKDGHEWKTEMKFPYGYILLTEGADGEHLDCYVGDDRDSKRVFIVHQNDPSTGAYDEDKVMLGFSTLEDARAAYLAQYDRPGFLGSMQEMTMEAFKAMLEEDRETRRQGKAASVDIRPLFLNLAQQVQKVCKAALPVGHISTHADGSKWKKQPDGSWAKVTDPGTPAAEEKKDPEGKPRPPSIAQLQGDFNKIKEEISRAGGTNDDLRNRFKTILVDMSDNYTKEYYVGKDGREYRVVMDLNAKGKYWIIDATNPDEPRLVGDKGGRDYELATAREKINALGGDRRDLRSETLKEKGTPIEDVADKEPKKIEQKVEPVQEPKQIEKAINEAAPENRSEVQAQLMGFQPGEPTAADAAEEASAEYKFEPAEEESAENRS